MDKILLKVPFAEKDQAKALGARWDPNLKSWYILPAQDKGAFSRWLPVDPELLPYNITSEGGQFYILKGKRKCFSCKKETQVFTFALNPYWYFDPEYEAEDDEDKWDLVNDLVMIHYVRRLNEAAQAVMKKFTQSYNCDHSGTIDDAYYANHCENCGKLQGDFFLFEDFDDGFIVTTPEAAAHMTLYKVKGFLEAYADFQDVPFAEYIPVQEIT